MAIIIIIIATSSSNMAACAAVPKKKKTVTHNVLVGVYWYLLLLLLLSTRMTSSQAFVFPSTNVATTTRRYRTVVVPVVPQQQQPTQVLLHAAGKQQPQQQPTDNNNNNNSNKKKRPPRPPRFSQIVHKSNSNQKKAPPSATASTAGVNTDRVWQSRKKTVEELEDILAKRWGTNLSAFTSQDWSDDDDDEQQEKVAPAPIFRAKPVVDPWNNNNNKETTTTNNKKQQSTTTRTTNALSRDYYDEDDEGYESSSTTTTTTSAGGSFHYMIAPKPAGASGRTSSSSSSAAAAKREESSYFLRPPPPVSSSKPSAAAATTTTTKESDTHDPQDNDKPPRRERIVPLALLDEEGDAICLTISQAERLFQEQTGGITQSAELEVDVDKEENDAADDDYEDEDEDYEYEEEEFPLAAMAAQSNQQWTDLGITDPTLLENLADMVCPSPLPVQQTACPDVLAGQVDVVIGTYTGSGKTLAFLVPLLQRLVRDDVSPDQLSVLIVAPGRELASQIVSVARQVCEGTPYTAQLAIGGTTFTRNLQTIRQRKPSILVGTPGRLAELIVGKPGEKSGRLKVNQLQSLVLDEFDALLEYKPHREPTAALVQKLQRNPNLQTILCSATATDVLESPKFQRFVRPNYALALTDQDDIFVTESGTNGKAPAPRVSRTVMHGVVHVPHRRFVIETIRRILHTDPLPQQILMFVDSSRKVDLLVEKLENMGILAAALHGGDSRNNDKMDRAQVSKALREGYVGIVVATELAARGLDAPLLTHVINVDLPTDASHYAHRAGRCGRGGRPGVVINLTSDPKERKVPEKFANQLGIDLYSVDVRNGRLNVVNPETVDLDNL